jgi:hypothetical protein
MNGEAEWASEALPPDQALRRHTPGGKPEDGAASRLHSGPGLLDPGAWAALDGLEHHAIFVGEFGELIEMGGAHICVYVEGKRISLNPTETSGSTLSVPHTRFPTEGFKLNKSAPLSSMGLN